ncbi:hypothetical protein COCVIDRAFT_115195 [Bipolaris victoriae FI3]|uniref:Uncharacterized protein n=2 Tax=Bipolaris TaxID=33194 RepID=W6YSS1_COCC2|nr:uncharacterized protein COCCADRAFT_93181 [Bipolaris zeicola 26-R-13]XP_014550536.1 hypothetical protein COCVIDRAFT_115195 [Bipolaris victoriae FI3]EUC34551.1 hypothetical protein COCCADRAFT_93181 [Bipolaris zeicola 26-R-13]
MQGFHVRVFSWPSWPGGGTLASWYRFTSPPQEPTPCALQTSQFVRVWSVIPNLATVRKHDQLPDWQAVMATSQPSLFRLMRAHLNLSWWVPSCCCSSVPTSHPTQGRPRTCVAQELGHATLGGGVQCPGPKHVVALFQNSQLSLCTCTLGEASIAQVPPPLRLY